MATFFSNLFYFFLTSLVLVFITLSSLEFYYTRPGPSINDQLLAINRGQNVAEVAGLLKELNLIESRLAFILISGMKGFHHKLKFGERAKKSDGDVSSKPCLFMWRSTATTIHACMSACHVS